MLKIFQTRLQQFMNWEIPDVQTGFRKVRRTRDLTANIHWIIEKVRGLQKSIYFFIDYVKAFDCVDHNKLWKILKRIGITDHVTYLLRNLYAGQEATELDMEQLEYNKAIYYCLAYLTSMQGISCQMPGLMTHKLESRFPGEISITSVMQVISL